MSLIFWHTQSYSFRGICGIYPYKINLLQTTNHQAPYTKPPASSIVRTGKETCSAKAVLVTWKIQIYQMAWEYDGKLTRRKSHWLGGPWKSHWTIDSLWISCHIFERQYWSLPIQPQKHSVWTNNRSGVYPAWETGWNLKSDLNTTCSKQLHTPGRVCIALADQTCVASQPTKHQHGRSLKRSMFDTYHFNVTLSIPIFLVCACYLVSDN